MKTLRIAGLLICAGMLRAEIVDRIAVIVNKRVVKDSDIDFDLRATAFLNATPLVINDKARGEAAQRLIDQAIIRDALSRGEYETAPVSQSVAMLDDIKTSRFNNDIAYRSALKNYGITEEDLKEKLFFQMTVLHFIDLRFRPGVLVTDDEIKSYYDAHRQQYRGTLDESRGSIQETVAADRVNQLLFDWLERRRKAVKIVYREEALKQP